MNTKYYPQPARSRLLTRTLSSLAALALLGCQGQISSPGEERGFSGTANPPLTPESSPSGQRCGAPSQRIWKLTPAQLTLSARALLPFAEDFEPELAATLATAEDAFSNDAGGLSMSEPHVEALFDVARKLGDQAAKAPTAISACLAQLPASDACARDFIGQLGTRAFRRPLASDELETFTSFFTQAQTNYGGATALSLTVRALLLSPNFLYRTELGSPAAPGGETVELTQYERASALSYLITDGPPDAELARVAAAAELDGAEALTLQARRLLTSEARGVLRFFTENWSTDSVLFARKDPMLFPSFGEALAADMASESLHFLQAVLFQEDARFRTLLTAEYSYVNERLASFYGVSGVQGSEFRRVILPAGQRTGILTHGSVLSAMAHEADSDVVKRGKFIREAMLCQPLPPPPATVNAVPPPADGMRTQRERLAQHTLDPSCAGCHNLTDPLGYPFERYDGIGQYRTEDAGKTIDPSGSLTDVEGPDRPVNDALDLAAQLSGLPEARQCIARRLHAYAYGRSRQAANGCSLEPVMARFEETDGDLLETIAAIVAEPDFIQRKAQ